jgi:ribosomal protein L14E/L6E/L27E
MVTRKYNAAMDDIVHALSLDNDVLVVVDVDKLYADRCDKDDIPNHAVVLTAIDLVSDKVTIFDPQENSKVSIPVSDFEQAWNVSHNYMVCVLQSIDDYEPQPINLEHVELTEDLLELQEAIAENAHEVWAAARKKEGWTYGKERDDANKKHPDLIPYSSLPDSEKEYDRLMAFDTIKLVKKLGFEIVKKRE